MLMPKNGAATAAPCGKNNMAVYPSYNGAAGDIYQQTAMPLNGQYPVASKYIQIVSVRSQSCLGSAF